MTVTGPAFRISSYCHTGGCVAVAPAGDAVLVRSSVDLDGPVLSFTPREWTAFLDGTRAEES